MPEGGHPSHHSITSSASDLAQNYFSRISWIVSIVLLWPLAVAILA